MKIEVFLNGHPIEINKDIDFVLNKQFTELTDLTAIIVDYSKTVSVPMTAYNNELFNNIFKFEHQVIVGQNIINYDPSQKIPMTINYNNSLVMEGYAVLNSINYSTKTYEINLYGQLGKIFNQLKDKVLSEFLGGINLQMMMCNKEIINSFNKQTRTGFGEISTDWKDWFGFAPQLYGKTDVIDTKSYQATDLTITNFKDTINTARGIEYGEVYVGDGFDLNNYGEMRSYLTRPYVYIDKLIALVKNEINSHPEIYDDYKLELDTDWFNERNPYFTDLCYFPGRETIIDKGKSISGIVTWDESKTNSLYFPMSYLPSKTSDSLDGYVYSTQYNTIYITKPGSSTPEQLDCTIVIDASQLVIEDIVTSTEKVDKATTWAFYNLDDPSVVPIRYLGIYDRMDNLMYKLYFCPDNINIFKYWKESGFLSWGSGHSETTIPNMWKTLRKNQNVITPNSVTEVLEHIDGGKANKRTMTYNFGKITLNKNMFKFKFGCDNINIYTGFPVKENISTSEFTTECPFKNRNGSNNAWKSGAKLTQNFKFLRSVELTSLTYRSYSQWTLNEILGDDFKPLNWLINYVKKFRLFFDIDYNSKKILIKSGYFNTIDYKKMTIDYSKDVIIEPIVEKYQNVTYGYAENKSKKGKKYKNKFNVGYGDMMIDTGIEINNEKMTLISEKEESVFIPTLTSGILWSDLKDSTKTIQYSDLLGTNKVINTLNEKNEIDYFPFYCFRLKNKILDKPIRLTDDPNEQSFTGKYTLLDDGLGWTTRAKDGDNYFMRLCYSIPQFDNYIEKEIVVSEDTSIRPNQITMPSIADGQIVLDKDFNTEVGLTDGLNKKYYKYTDPITGDDLLVEKYIDWNNVFPVNPFNPWTPTTGGDTGTGSGSGTGTGTGGGTGTGSGTGGDGIIQEPETQRVIYWSTFGIPKEIYNGELSTSIASYSIYDRWIKYLNEVFNVNNKKVTCYVIMSYPDFINFSFNKLFVIDNSIFLCNKIFDFNPNSSEPTKVELIQISEPNNLK